jgi:hypothetical protein
MIFCYTFAVVYNCWVVLTNICHNVWSKVMSPWSTIYIQSVCIYMHIKVECEIMCYINIHLPNFVTCNKVWFMNFLENFYFQKLQLQKLLRNGQNISEINPLFALVHDSDAQARRRYTPLSKTTKHSFGTLYNLKRDMLYTYASASIYYDIFCLI